MPTCHVTPLKTNMSCENQWLEDVFPTKIVPFLGDMLNFWGVVFFGFSASSGATMTFFGKDPGEVLCSDQSPSAGTCYIFPLNEVLAKFLFLQEEIPKKNKIAGCSVIMRSLYSIMYMKVYIYIYILYMHDMYIVYISRIHVWYIHLHLPQELFTCR